MFRRAWATVSFRLGQPGSSGSRRFFNRIDPVPQPGHVDEIKFGITARCSKNSGSLVACTGPQTEGRFEYFNRFTGFKIKGRITSFHMQTAADSLCQPSFLLGPPETAPTASIQGQCDDDSICSMFQIDVVDVDPKGNGADWVCNVHVHGIDKKGRTEDNDDQPGQPLNRGKVELHPE